MNPEIPKLSVSPPTQHISLLPRGMPHIAMKSIYTVRRFPQDRICTNAGFEAQPEKETIKTASWLEVDEKARSFTGNQGNSGFGERWKARSLALKGRELRNGSTGYILRLRTLSAGRIAQ